MQRRNRIRAVSFLLALIGALTVWGVTATVQAKRYRAQARVTQQRALTLLGEYTDTMETTLLKATYAATPGMLERLAADLQTLSLGAKTSLAALDSGETALYNMYKYLSQVGEYTDALGQKMRRGEAVTAQERENLASLTETAKRLSAQLRYMTRRSLRTDSLIPHSFTGTTRIP